jgi:ribosomal protein S12 methylthiotransferase
MSPAVHFVALGCPKNRVDTERMAGLARRCGMALSADPARADVIVVNTCGFIQPATQESIDTVLELLRHKEGGRCSTLVVAGCLSQRYADELARELPEVDHFIGTEDLPRLAEILEGAAPRVAISPPGGPLLDPDYDRVPDTGAPHTAYLKIAEGCDRRCAFCIIPHLRGPQRSRTTPSLAAEAEHLVRRGARELNLVAQDTTAYGRDLAPSPTLPRLLSTLDGLDDLRWIRLLYAYPTAVDRELMRTIASLPRVVPYIDVPLQHVDDHVLRAMHRGHGGALTRRLIEDLRAEVPGVHIRTTLLVGHPGETEAAFQALADFVAWAELDHVGVFPFSREEGTAAFDQTDQVPEAVALERAAALMEQQREISRRKLARLRGQELEVMVDGPSPESEYLLQARHAGQAPEVDGVVVLTDSAGLHTAGDLVLVEVTDSGDYDLVASPVEGRGFV